MLGIEMGDKTNDELADQVNRSVMHFMCEKMLEAGNGPAVIAGAIAAIVELLHKVGPKDGDPDVLRTAIVTAVDSYVAQIFPDWTSPETAQAGEETDHG